jgi:hypothetical protein
MAPKKLENNFLVSTLGKLLVFLVNYAYYATIFLLWKSELRGALGVSECIIGISIISYGKNNLDLRPTWVTTSPREQIEFVSQGPTVYITIYFHICIL